MPSGHLDDRQLRAEMPLAVEELGELSHGHTGPHGFGVRIDVVFASPRAERALHSDTIHGVGPVEDDHIDVIGSGGFEEVLHECLEGPVAYANILEIDDNGIEAGQLLGRGMALGLGRPVETDDG